MRARFLQPWGGSQSEPYGEPGEVVELDEATYDYLLKRRYVEPAPNEPLTPRAEVVKPPPIPRVKVVKATGSKPV